VDLRFELTRCSGKTRWAAMPFIWNITRFLFRKLALAQETPFVVYVVGTDFQNICRVHLSILEKDTVAIDLNRLDYVRLA